MLEYIEFIKLVEEYVKSLKGSNGEGRVKDALNKLKIGYSGMYSLGYGDPNLSSGGEGMAYSSDGLRVF